MSDEGFREIQLNGKQLIFLFMAVTVVSVVIFLFGVLVGRGVRDGAEPADTAGLQVAPDSAVPSAADGPGPAAPAETADGQAPAAPPAEELSYAERLLRDTPADENLKTSATSGAAASAPVVQEPVAERAPVPAPAGPNKGAPSAANARTPRNAQPTSVPAGDAAAQASDPTGPGFAVQVAALPDRQAAEELVKQLAGKGYPAFLLDPVKGAPTKLFRVRVGKYPNRNVAEGVQAQLAKAEQFTTAWIAR